MLMGLEWKFDWGKGWQGFDCNKPPLNCTTTYFILGNMLEYVLTILVIIFNINPLDEMYYMLKVREAYKLGFLVQKMKGDPNNKVAWNNYDRSGEFGESE